MKKIVFTFLVMLVIFLISSASILCQSSVKERPDMLSELNELAQVFSYEEDTHNNISTTIYQFSGTAEEALVFVKEELFKDDNQDLEMEFDKMDLSEILISMKAMAEQGFSPILDEEWIIRADNEISRFKDLEQVVYSGGIEYPDIEKDVTIQSPFFNPVSFKVIEGTYIIYSESKFNNDSGNIRGEKVDLSNKLADNFLEGSWTIKERGEVNRFENQVPELKIRIGELVGSFEESEIDAERYLFSGDIEINGVSYKAYTKLDPVNVFAYPIRIISIIKEEGMDYQLEIWIEDIEKDINLNILSDFEEAYEKAFAVEVYYSNYGQGEEYETDYNAVDYLVKD